MMVLWAGISGGSSEGYGYKPGSAICFAGSNDADAGDAPSIMSRATRRSSIIRASDRDRRSATGEIREAEIFVAVLGASN